MHTQGLYRCFCSLRNSSGVAVCCCVCFGRKVKEDRFVGAHSVWGPLWAGGASSAFLWYLRHADFIVLIRFVFCGLCHL